jgi:ABC transporter with metal-binding/Fe-S-binding domain ATP-binding protein
MMRAAVLFSGGKDSVYATYIAQQQHFDIVGTVTIVPSVSDSYMFHVPNAGFASMISSAMGIPNLTAEVPPKKDELKILSQAIESIGVDAVITGAIASDYQMFRINFVCEELGVKAFSPLWHKNQEALFREIVGAGFDVRMVGVAADGLDESWLGRAVDSKAIDDLVALQRKRRINVSGEGGEFETVVLDGPDFCRRIRISSSSVRWTGSSGLLRIHALRLENKGRRCSVPPRAASPSR